MTWWGKDPTPPEPKQPPEVVVTLTWQGGMNTQETITCEKTGIYNQVLILHRVDHTPDDRCIPVAHLKEWTETVIRPVLYQFAV